MKASDLDLLLPQPDADPGPKFRWASVTQASPLRIRIDGEADPLTFTPSTLAAGLIVGDRVLAVVAGRQLVVLGTANGAGGVPAGTVSAYAGTSTPPGWVWCVGQVVSRATYARLFTAIGTIYGAGDGTTTFQLPDGRGRVLVGYDGDRAEFNAIGKKGGATTHALTAAENGPHTHTVYGRVDRYQSLGDAFREPTDAQFGTNNTTTSSSGSGAPHNNLQPYLTLSNYIIKT